MSNDIIFVTPLLPLLPEHLSHEKVKSQETELKIVPLLFLFTAHWALVLGSVSGLNTDDGTDGLIM